MRFSWLLLLLLSSVEGLPIVSEDHDALMSEKCLQCRFSVDLLEKKWGEDTADCMGDLVIFICTNFDIESHYICRSIMTNYKAEVLYVLDNVVATPKELCSLLVDDCGQFVDPVKAAWELPMPGTKPPVVEKSPIPSGHPTMRVLHLTDLHIDKDYVVGSEAQCSAGELVSLCCRPTDDHDEVLAASPIKEPAGYWGTVGQCDAPYWFVDNMLKQLADKHKDISHILLTGDLESHAVWDYTKEEHAQRIQNVSRLIKSHFPTTPVYMAIGNHEGVPMDSFAPHFTPAEFNMDWLYGTIASSWNDSIPQDQMDTVHYNGCYMKRIIPGLRLISLNNGYGDAMNFFLLMNQTDPDGSMSWFIDQLYEAEKAGDKVHIIAHIPGGTPEGLESWAMNYYRTVIRFENTIAGQFFGHVHSEQFYMIYENPEDANSRPVDVIYSAPSVTPYSRYSPAYRIYTMDGHYPGSSYIRVIDWEEYMFNLTENNVAPYTPLWKTLYPSVVQEYDLSANLPSEWSNLINRMKTDDTLFLKFMKNFFRRTDYPAYDQKKRFTQLCDMRQAHHSKALCADLIDGMNSSQPATVVEKKKSVDMASITSRLERKKEKGADKCEV